ncbi:MAG: hypothetical protein J7L38_00060 [Thermoproteales archaeon]|nr:hypothetical protein [Thermoproteales archaeon]RLE64206.1 MAG: hypothetical protein DRJ47_08185 [Thermoprotei archaeon]
MPRKKVIDKIIREVKYTDEDDLYLVVYDFKVGGGRIPPRFYKNLDEFISRGARITRVQKSVLLCRGEQSARVIAKLAEYYGAEVHVFRIHE